MAGIEKVCELTGECCGYEMYTMKRNQIQIHRKHRKKFAGAAHTLKIIPEELYFVYHFGGMTQYEIGDDYFQRIKGRIVRQYRYELTVADPALAGRVNGVYINWSTDISTVKRKLKRLLKCKKLNIV